MPVEIMYGSPVRQPATLPEYVAELRSDLESAYDQVRNQIGHALDRHKELYDQTEVHGNPFKPGDLVWLHSPAILRGQSRKLHRPWSGPFRVVSKLSEETYRIANTRARRQRLTVHFDRLKLCPSDIRLSKDTHPSPQAQQYPQVESNRNNSIPGTQVELINVTSNAQIPMPPPARHYPSHDRRPPAYLANYIQH